VKKTIKMAKRYGKLTVLGEHTDEGSHRRVATVKCRCGAVKYVLADALFSGRTRSCGMGACKFKRGTGKPPGRFRPSIPRVIPTSTIANAWRTYTHENHKKRANVLELAYKYGVSPSTLSTIFRHIEWSGGLTKYLKYIGASSEQ